MSLTHIGSKNKGIIKHTSMLIRSRGSELFESLYTDVSMSARNSYSVL